MRVKRQHGTLAGNGSGIGRYVRLAVQEIDVPGTAVQAELRGVRVRTLESPYRFESILQGLQTSRQVWIVRDDPGAAHVPFRSVPRCPHGIHIVDRGTLTGMLRIFGDVQVADQLWLGHFSNSGIK